MNELKDYQPIIKFLKDEDGNQLADSQNILNMQKNCFSQLLKAHKVNYISQIKVHTAGLLVSEDRFLRLKLPLESSKGLNCYVSLEYW